jgi:hypothetical protein
MPTPAATRKTPLSPIRINTGAKTIGDMNCPINPNVPMYELNRPRNDAGTISPIQTGIVGMTMPKPMPNKAIAVKISKLKFA